jgi:hypothetical protein
MTESNESAESAEPTASAESAEPTASAESGGSILDSYAEPVTAVLALVVGVAHVFHPDLGFFTFAARVTTVPTLLLSDPRPALFVVSGLAVVVGVALSRDALDRRPYYFAGLALFSGYVVGYFGWHLSGHGGFLPGREPLYHGLTPVENVLSHLGSEPFAALLIALELVTVLLLVWLLSRESRRVAA